jgi:hypothetical protein
MTRIFFKIHRALVLGKVAPLAISAASGEALTKCMQLLDESLCFLGGRVEGVFIKECEKIAFKS